MSNRSTSNAFRPHHRHSVRWGRYLSLVAAAVLAIQSTAALAADETLPKAEQILDEFVAATGGVDAHNKLKNRIIKGTFEIAGMGIKAKLTNYSAAPRNTYTLIESDMLGNIESGTDGTVAWEMTSMMGPQIKKDAERALHMREALFNSHLHWKEQYKTVECNGAEDVEGKPCYKVVLTPGEGNPLTNYYDKKSHLLIKTEFMMKTQMGTMPIVIHLDDYKSVDGVLLPHKIRQEVGTIQKVNIVTESIEHNVEMPADRFKLPADIQALLKKDEAKKDEAKKDESKKDEPED